MNGKKLARGIQAYRKAIEKAWEDGDDLPVVEAAISKADQEHIDRKFGTVVANMIERLGEARDATQEAIEDYDQVIDELELVANGLAATELVEQRAAEVAPLPTIPEGDPTSGEGFEPGAGINYGGGEE